jgi:hypothetical protein
MLSDTGLGLLGPVSFVGLPSSVEPDESTGPMQANIFSFLNKTLTLIHFFLQNFTRNF